MTRFDHGLQGQIESNARKWDPGVAATFWADLNSVVVVEAFKSCDVVPHSWLRFCRSATPQSDSRPPLAKQIEARFRSPTLLTTARQTHGKMGEPSCNAVLR